MPFAAKEGMLASPSAEEHPQIVKIGVIFVGLLLLAFASAQQDDEPHPKGTIYGVAIDQNGQPAKRIGLTASPLSVALAALLPHTRTNDAGEYRFENLPWWGRYTVYADDEDAGYSSFSTGPTVKATHQRLKSRRNIHKRN